MSSADTATSTVSPPAGRSPSWGWRIWVMIMGLLIAAGLATWIYQLTQGLQISQMRDNVIWGLYIITFMFFVGLSAGG